MKSAKLKVKVKPGGDDIRKVVLNGAIDGHTSAMFDEVLQDLIEKGIRKIILDYADVSYMSSAGVGVLISVNQQMEEEFGKDFKGIVILNAIESIKDVFNILEIHETFIFTDNESTAKELLN